MPVVEVVVVIGEPPEFPGVEFVPVNSGVFGDVGMPSFKYLLFKGFQSCGGGGHGGLLSICRCEMGVNCQGGEK